MNMQRETAVRDLVENFIEPHLNLSLGAAGAVSG